MHTIKNLFKMESLKYNKESLKKLFPDEKVISESNITFQKIKRTKKIAGLPIGYQK